MGITDWSSDFPGTQKMAWERNSRGERSLFVKLGLLVIGSVVAYQFFPDPASQGEFLGLAFMSLLTAVIPAVVLHSLWLRLFCSIIGRPDHYTIAGDEQGITLLLPGQVASRWNLFTVVSYVPMEIPMDERYTFPFACGNNMRIVARVSGRRVVYPDAEMKPQILKGMDAVREFLKASESVRLEALIKRELGPFPKEFPSAKDYREHYFNHPHRIHDLQIDWFIEAAADVVLPVVREAWIREHRQLLR